jgi:glycine/D-amino acid oxidase-like deaminating enzyme
MFQTVFERQAPRESVIRDALENSVNRPFWIEDAGRKNYFPQLQDAVDTDLLIVGGGYLGLWTAILAKERDPLRSVSLLEGKLVGWAASGRNGGFCEASITHGEEIAQRRWPEEAEKLKEMGLENLEEMEATIRRYGIACDFERTGVMAVAVESYQDVHLRGEGYLTQEEVRAEVASPTFLSGRWDKRGTAMLHPGKLVLELARVATQLGVKIYEDSQVTGLKSKGQRMLVQTAQGSVSAARVVLATNAFPSLLKRFSLHTVPVYDYALMSEPLSASQLDAVGWKSRQGIADMGNQFHYYRLTKDNRILFGGYDAIYNFGGKIDKQHDDRTQSFMHLASHFFTTFPQLEGLRFSHRWGGVIDTSTRLCAFYTLSYGGKVAYAAGFTGLGVGATRFAANVLLDKIEGRDTERTRLRMVREVPMPFPPEPIAYATIRATQWALKKADRNQGKRNLLLRCMDAVGLGFDS